MTWKTEWDALSARIVSLLEVARLYAISGAQEFHGASSETLVPHGREVFLLVERFSERFASDLPVAMRDALARFITTKRSSFQQGNVIGLPGALFMVGLLEMVRAEAAYLASDFEYAVRHRIDLAFTHLQRSIIVDADERKKWTDAWKKHEPRCEARGAVHLLQHGIWAFKADAAGGRTDLILGGPPRLDEARRAADALVLTEWKRVQEGDSAETKALEAHAQAERYAGELLAGFELQSRRYIVLVSEAPLSPLPSVPQGSGLHYEVIGIAVNPPTPSVTARRATS